MLSGLYTDCSFIHNKVHIILFNQTHFLLISLAHPVSQTHQLLFLKAKLQARPIHTSCSFL